MIATLATLLLTAVIATSTVVYTVYSIRLWKATRLSADISRYTLFISFIMEMDRQVQIAKATNRPDAAFLEQFSRLLMENGMKAVFRGVDLKKNQELAQFISEMDGMLRASNLPDAPWLRGLIDGATGKSKS
jgi:hypothetical protein